MIASSTTAEIESATAAHLQEPGYVRE
jgi:hypothetical protein